LEIDSKLVPTALAFDPLKGAVYPPLLAGHEPRAEDQIVLGTKTMKSLHRRLGQSVSIATPLGKLNLQIVGSMVAPSVGDLFTNDMGEGAWVYGPAVKVQAGADQAASSSATPPTVFNLVAVRFASGVSTAAALATLRLQFGGDVLTDLPSEDVLNLRNVDRLPALLAGLVGVLGIATIGDSLIASVRGRRRDLAILKTIGFLGTQVQSIVFWQATTLSVVALVAGIPLGIAVGHWTWTAVASGLGASSLALVPATVALVIPAALILVNVMAAAPGRIAARLSPARVMRSQ
jgi:ABC-type lipoprotein release transport system permease subunit